jgi:hypothetical protein
MHAPPHLGASACRVSVFLNARDGEERNTISSKADVLSIQDYEKGVRVGRD